MVTAAAIALAVGLGGGWAGRSLLTRPAPLPAAAHYALATATKDTISRSLSLDAKATWSGGAEVAGGLAGTVTSVHLKGAVRVRPGQALFDVDLGPVVVAEGDIPSFRDLRAGDHGADVEQLQRFLNSTDGTQGRVDGRFSRELTPRVKAWQRRLGTATTGVVAKGALLFVPSLPAVVSVAPGVRVGTAAPVAVPAVKVLPATPSFSVLLPPNQASLTKPGMKVRLILGKATWVGMVTRLGAPGEDGSVLAAIGPGTGSRSVCATTCSAVPPGGATVSAAIEVVPATTGVTVPSQALVVGSDGRAAVAEADGRYVPVTVKATSGGIAVVDGLPAGRQIRVPTGG
jgi:peptidoglycan hydrolase-like protein with peptidoglycan-binding domain